MENFTQRLTQVRVPDSSTRVHKSECCFSFQTPKLPGGLFVCLRTFYAFKKEFAEFYFQKTKNCVFLHIVQTLKPKKDQDDGADIQSPPKKKPTLLAIGMEGGYEEPKDEYEDHYSLVVLPEWQEFKYPDNQLPLQVSLAVEGVLKAQEAQQKDKLDAWSLDKDLKVSKYSSTLKQISNGVKISKTGNKCSRCDKTDNLWLNLTDGTILCGRKNWDGSGGNNHAVEYYQETRFPLAVKLGTITAGGADVFSYVEDDMVIDSNLRDHLLHFGIKMEDWEKWDKTMDELQLDHNLSFDWNRIQENDQNLELLCGPGFTGLHNLGNSCYMASIMQTLFSLPIFHQRFTQLNQLVADFDFSRDPTNDLLIQLTKLGYGLQSGVYAETPEKNGVAPAMFKALIGKGHPEFSSMRQQDALEFYQHFLTQLERVETVRPKYDRYDTSSFLKMVIEERIECGTSHKVSYKIRTDNVLSLPIPESEATNKNELAQFLSRKAILEEKGEKISEVVRPQVPFRKCLESFFQTETIGDFFSSAINGRTHAFKTTRMRTFPPYLMFQMRRFVISPNWVLEKLDAFIVDVPDELDLGQYRGKGIQPGETELPEVSRAPKKPQADETIVSQLMEMTFPRLRCQKAALATNNSSTEAAAEWLFAHLEDPDIDSPIPEESGSSLDESKIDQSALAQLLVMGLPEKKVKKALLATNNDMERATDWVFSHLDDPDDDVPTPATPSTQPAIPDLPDGVPRYRLKALISHMGKSTSSGHYVCHIKRGAEWVLFNDAKVAVSKKPPTDLAYLYLYERIDS